MRNVRTTQCVYDSNVIILSGLGIILPGGGGSRDGVVVKSSAPEHKKTIAETKDKHVNIKENHAIEYESPQKTFR